MFVNQYKFLVVTEMFYEIQTTLAKPQPYFFKKLNLINL